MCVRVVAYYHIVHPLYVVHEWLFDLFYMCSFSLIAMFHVMIGSWLLLVCALDFHMYCVHMVNEHLVDVFPMYTSSLSVKSHAI